MCPADELGAFAVAPMAWYERLLAWILSLGPVPQSMGIIPDGNRRFATGHGITVDQGHVAGSHTLSRVGTWSSLVGVKESIIYIFSADNFRRPQTGRRRYEKERGRRGSRLGRWVPDPSLVTVEPGLPATFYLPRPCVADVLRLQGILCLRTRGAVGLRARVPAEVSGLYVVGGGAYTLQVAASSTVRATRSCRATGTSSSRCVQPRRGCGGGAYPSTSRLVDRADNASQLKT
ncbi:hypothetical protein HPB51_012137 [Rhipicephalus microplus]|uniref:ditrans,polycis-polyprenyl diphosphate synthase [(2E,6E)-farnesyldiphosphate specific] n=1 Tax=Rhipicephalus microplus TaxID=6941 RepID=A0A9J6DUG5_RHIMP|nr:hypothetical protein HPB51_012137 [Rhipicephalus microplus]